MISRIALGMNSPTDIIVRVIVAIGSIIAARTVIPVRTATGTAKRKAEVKRSPIQADPYSSRSTIGADEWVGWYPRPTAPILLCSMIARG